jgi:broad specificity phosphatase PhoE
VPFLRRAHPFTSTGEVPVKVYFVRHAESVANEEDTFSSNDPEIHPLTPRGEAQAADLAAELRAIHFDAAYSSDLLRAVQTTEILLKERDIQFHKIRRLREHNMGIYDGRRDEDAWIALRELVRVWVEEGRSDIGPEDGESLDVLQARFFSFMGDLTREFGEGNSTVLVVAHMGLFWSTLHALFENIDVEFIRAREFVNTGVVIGSFEDARWTCESWVGETLP